MATPACRPNPDDLEKLLAANEQWLMGRVLDHAKRLGYTKYTSTLEEAWRVSIEGLSRSFVAAVRARGCDLDIACDEDVLADSAVAFGVDEARAHRSRGVPFGMFLALMKYYRSAYQELMREKIADPDLAEAYSDLVLRFFDRAEIGFVTEWAGLGEATAVAELQECNRDMTNEKNKYLTLFESLNEPVFLLDADGLIENVNQAAASLFGLGDVSGSAYYSQVAVGHLFEPLGADIERFLHGRSEGAAVERELETVHGPRVFVMRLRRLLDVSGKFGGITIVLSDVTIRKRAEIATREAKDRFESLFHNMVDAFALCEVVRDAEGRAVDYRFLDVNEAFETMTGLEVDSVIGERATEAIPGLLEDPFDWVGTYARVADTEEMLAFERFFAPLDRWYRVRAFPSGTDKFAIVFTDISVLKRQEAELGRLVSERTAELKESLERLSHTADELADALRVKDEFLASMSHQLRTPLNSVLGFSGMLLEGMAGELNEEQGRQIGMIRAGGEQLLGLVNQVLDLSRLDAGRDDVSISEFDLIEVAELAAETLRPMADAKELGVVVRYDQMIVPMWSDRDKVAQVVLNIVSNAIKFTLRGKVDIEVGPARDGMSAWVRVRDTGVGIAPEDVERMFERFVRLAPPATGPEGTGLGLAITQRLVDVLGGRIEVESRLGKGSIFTVHLPVRHATAP